MTIEFYLNNEEETPITSFYGMVSNPFSLNDVINLSVEDLFPRDYEKYPESKITGLLKDNNEQRKLFNNKKVKLVKERKYVNYTIITETKLIIEYHCEFV
jgi:hypothetical protein